jgi:hypothetical protein
MLPSGKAMVNKESTAPCTLLVQFSQNAVFLFHPLQNLQANAVSEEIVVQYD